MSVQGDKIEKTNTDLRKFLPLVLTRFGTSIFNPELIYQSLLKETKISKNDAHKIMEHVIRFLISANLKIITAPLIREVVNVHLLKNGFERERLQYTRIGLPYFDLNEIFTNTENLQNCEDVVSKILNWVIEEYYAVDKLIEER